MLTGMTFLIASLAGAPASEPPPAEYQPAPSEFASVEEAVNALMEARGAWQAYSSLPLSVEEHVQHAISNRARLSELCPDRAIRRFLKNELKPRVTNRRPGREVTRVTIPVSLIAVKVGDRRLWGLVTAWEVHTPEHSDTFQAAHIRVYLLDAKTGSEVAGGTCG